MTDRVSLFDEMDHATDAPRKDNPELREALFDELQLLFNEIERRRMPELSAEEQLDLFKQWGLGYAARRANEREETIAGIIEHLDAFARLNPPSDPFVCLGCGEVLDDPCNPAVMAMHQLHYLAAKAR